eukprot:scaffold2378_cov137-Skeletonema_dohrnii-CCMP3373.AAC.6
MTDAPPRTPELTAEKHGSTSSNGAKKRRKKSKSNNGNANWNTTNGADNNNEVVDAAPESSQTVAPSVPSNGVNGAMHAISTSPKSTSSKQFLQNIVCLIIGIIIGYFGHELIHPSESLDDTKIGIFKTVLSRHRRKHKEIASDNNSPDALISAASEEIDRVHPIRHILEGASVFHHVKKQKQAIKATTKTTHKDVAEIEVDWKKWKFGMTDDFQLTSEQSNLVKELEQRVVSKAASIRVCPDGGEKECAEGDKQIASLSGGTNMPGRSFIERVDSVAWGGNDSDSTKWWPRKDAKDPNKLVPGGRLLAGYLKIMKWSLHAKYPHKLCEHGCDSEVSVLHTLEWREKYKPWCVTPKMIQYNKSGFMYRRGNSRPGPRKRLEAEKAKDSESLSTSGHALLFYRPGVTTVEDPDLYGRVMLNAIDSAVADSLVRNKGEIGRFNIIFDCKGFGSKNAPSLANVKLLFRYLQDHFPDRLGVLVVANLGGMAQMLMKMVLPFVTEDVRAKIHVIPNDEDGRREMLLQFIDEDKIPNWLGGNDDYEFDAKEYYKDEKCVLSEDEISNFLIDMPYHG